jgi:aspartate/methionine/tyrosine aminotransferase
MEMLVQAELLQLCVSKGVPIIADEVYQENIWQEGKSFTSFRKVALDQKIPATVFSLHSISKGFLGECGHRGGYLDVLNVPQPILIQLKKLMSISLCSNTVGQLLVAAMMAPPKSGDASYKLYKAERDAILASLQRRAKQLVEHLRKLESVTCELWLPPFCLSCTWPTIGILLFDQVFLTNFTVLVNHSSVLSPLIFVLSFKKRVSASCRASVGVLSA